NTAMVSFSTRAPQVETDRASFSVRFCFHRVFHACGRGTSAAVWVSLERFDLTRRSSAQWRQSKNRFPRQEREPRCLDGGRFGASRPAAHAFYLQERLTLRR